MHETIRTCDKCKRVLAAEDRLWKLRLSSWALGNARGADYYDRQPMQQGAELEWCEPCMLAAGLRTGTKQPQPPDPTPMEKLEAIFREIMYEVAEDAITAARNV